MSKVARSCDGNSIDFRSGRRMNGKRERYCSIILARYDLRGYKGIRKYAYSRLLSLETRVTHTGRRRP